MPGAKDLWTWIEQGRGAAVVIGKTEGESGYYENLDKAEDDSSA